MLIISYNHIDIISYFVIPNRSCAETLFLIVYILQVRGVEIGIVLLVLVVWVGAIALFFNRWGKIRMLLPYQPDYKEQLKVPGTAACAAAVAAGNTCAHASGDHMCSQVYYIFLLINP